MIANKNSSARGASDGPIKQTSAERLLSSKTTQGKLPLSSSLTRAQSKDARVAGSDEVPESHIACLAGPGVRCCCCQIVDVRPRVWGESACARTSCMDVVRNLSVKGDPGSERALFWNCGRSVGHFLGAIKGRPIRLAVIQCGICSMVV